MKKLNYQLNINLKESELIIVFIHGLFGNLSNFNSLVKILNQKKHNTLQIDLRNHGKSPHEEVMNYKVMAQDVFDLLYYLHIPKCIVVGHSLGGKVAMTLPMLAMNNVTKISKMIIIDIAPINYTKNKNLNIFSAIDYVNQFSVKTKNAAFILMKKFIQDQKIIFFLLKSFRNGQWDFNTESIKKNYVILNRWEKYDPWVGEILFIKGSYSSYIKDCYYNAIYEQFPKACIKIVHAGHWVHTEQKDVVLKIINDFVFQ